MFEPCTRFCVTITTSNYIIYFQICLKGYISKYKYLSKKINVLKNIGTVFRPLYIDIEHKEAYFYDLFYIFY